MNNAAKPRADVTCGSFLVGTLLTIRWKLYRYFLWTQVSTEQPALASQAREEAPHVLPLLTQLLRKYPFWFRGHVELGNAALAQGDRELGYASAQAALQLRPVEEAYEGAFLLARCYLAGGRYEEAATLLRELLFRYPRVWPVREEFVAALIALERYAEATEALGQIPREHLSPEGENIGRYLAARKKSGTQ